MATLTYYVGTDTYTSIAPRISPTTLTEQSVGSSLVRLGSGSYTQTYYGAGLAISSRFLNYSSWTAGTVTGYEERNGSQLLLKYENMSIPAISLNGSTNFGGTRPISNIFLSGNNQITGSPFSDRLSGGTGSDSITGGAGNDTIVPATNGGVLDGGPGLDMVDFSALRMSSADYSVFPKENVPGSWIVWPKDLLGAVLYGYWTEHTLRDVEQVRFTDKTISLLERALGSPTAPDLKGTQVFRFAKVDSGQYFYTGNVAERDYLQANMSNFRYEGPVFFAQDNWVTNYNPVYRFANLENGGYFYTSSAAERDTVISDYPAYRYEGATFFVPARADADTVPVFRLANTRTGGYLFTTSAAERQFAQSLGFFRDEGIAFNAPRTMSLVDSCQGATAIEGFDTVEIALVSPDALDGTVWLI